ncbi:MAG: VIT domain-containing protein [Phycisphaerae bacterium]
MTTRSCRPLGFVALLFAGVASSLAFAQGTVLTREPVPLPPVTRPVPPHRPPPPRVTTTPLELKYQRIYVEITDGVAVTRVEQTLRNPLGVTVEGTYVFPLPDDVAVGDFSMTMDGKTLTGEVLDKDQARRTYEQIVRQMRDPGLLELIGTRLFRASIAPIRPGGELAVKLQYSQTLREQAGLGLYQHPLRPIAGADNLIGELVVSVKVRSELPLLSVFSPTHEVSISRPGDHEASLSFERTRFRPDRDFQLYYQRKDSRMGISLLTHRQPGEDGYFLLRLSPRIEAEKDETLPKDIAFVVDVSGSMKGEKIEQARRALKFCIKSLGPRDRFNIYPFSTGVQPFRDKLVAVDTDTRDAAIKFAEELQANGGTNINGALAAALDNDPRDDSRPYLVVFMTDGQPTVELTVPEEILKNVAKRNSRGVRFHVLGVGNDVSTELLDKLAEMNRGSRDYCVEGEDLEIKLSALAGRLANPLMTDIVLEIEDLGVKDVYPQKLPDLFRGGEIVVLGRYATSGHRAVTLRGQVRGDRLALKYEGEFPQRNRENDFLPRLWAQRKVAYLVDQIRLYGRSEELVSEVVRLATRHGIVTPYTSSLIVEEGEALALAPAQDAVRRAVTPAAIPMGGGKGAGGGGTLAAGGGGRMASPGFAGDGKGGGLPAASPEASRQIAVGKQADVLIAGFSKDDDEARERALVRHVRDKTFTLVDGRYVDNDWDGKKEVRKVVAFSDEYFKLLDDQPELREFVAISDRMVIVWGQRVIEIVPPPEPEK